MLAAVMARVGALAAAKGLVLSVDVAGVPDTVRGDPLRLSQILINLLSNAVKFTERGTVHLRGRVVPGPARQRPGHVCLRFEVEDTGPGISPDQQASLFTPFMQVDASTSRRHGGAGLGLALSRQLARAMHGDIGVISAEGAGSTFWFTVCLGRIDLAVEALSTLPPIAGMPAIPSIASIPTVPPSMPIAGTPYSRGELEFRLRTRHRGQRLLLAEDNPVNREVARELLATVGLSVDVAVDGRAAVERVLAAPYDLVLMDMQMPHMDGIEAALAIRAGLGRALPIIAMTASATSEDRAACLAAGMDDHLPKPVEPALLFSTLLRWLPDPADAARTAGSPADANLERWLVHVADIDLVSALRNVGGQSNTLLRALRVFARTYQGGLPALLDTSGPEPAGFQAWRSACHSARGALETIGAHRIAADVQRFEELLHLDSKRAEHLPRAQAIHRQIENLSRELDRELDR